MALALNTPLAEAISNKIQPKLVEIGWSVGGDDSSPLAEYICLMLVNGKSQTQLAAELSGDLLGLAPEDNTATEFAKWLFAEYENMMKNQNWTGENSGSAAAPGDGEDMEMREGSEDQETVPTAPKAMRQSGPGGRRLVNQLNKALERKPEDDVLRRVRPQGQERVDKFRREPPKGPANNRPNSRPNNNRGGPHQNRMNGGRGHFGPNMPPLQNMSPEQQMAFYQMFQQQAQMIAPFAQGGPMPGPGFHGGPHGGRGGPAFNQIFNHHRRQHQQNPNAGGSLFDRIQAPPDLSQDSEMEAAEESRETSQSSHSDKPEEIPCKFGTGCTKLECIFGHPTPSAPHGRGIVYVSGEKCSFGIGCKNRKCTGSHPSPAAVSGWSSKPNKIDQDCKFFPNCSNAACPFKHPAMPMCRNGADCTRPDCHFTHTPTVACKFNPCLNPHCIYQHEDGQQQLGNKVWKAPGAGHVSERRFVTDGQGPEELILPGAAGDMDTAPMAITDDGVA